MESSYIHIVGDDYMNFYCVIETKLYFELVEHSLGIVLVNQKGFLPIPFIRVVGKNIHLFADRAYH